MKKMVISGITGTCAALTTMNALNGALNYATGKPGDTKQTNLIYTIGMTAISVVVGAIVSKKTALAIDGLQRVSTACKDKFESDLAAKKEEEFVTPNGWDYVEPSDADSN